MPCSAGGAVSAGYGKDPGGRSYQIPQICLVFHLFSMTGSQLLQAPDVGTWAVDQKIMLKLFDHAFESAE